MRLSVRLYEHSGSRDETRLVVRGAPMLRNGFLVSHDLTRIRAHIATAITDSTRDSASSRRSCHIILVAVHAEVFSAFSHLLERSCRRPVSRILAHCHQLRSRFMKCTCNSCNVNLKSRRWWSTSLEGLKPDTGIPGLEEKMQQPNSVGSSQFLFSLLVQVVNHVVCSKVHHCLSCFLVNCCGLDLRT